MSTYKFTGKAQTFTAPNAGTYDITAYGGQGGAFAGRYAGNTTGGYGAEISGAFTLTKGEKLEIIVGGAGGNSTSFQANNGGGGGGGGSFVLESLGGGKYTPLLVAAGGGGGGYSAGSGGNIDAANGKGGAGSTNNNGGGGGAGYGSSGGMSLYGGSGGKNHTGGFAGGAGTTVATAGKGGFGGGGGGGVGAGGGGGGYSGGAGGSSGAGGQGGGSIDNGTPITLFGTNSGNGKVVIEAVTCFASGTSIKTKRGDIAVEHLAVGDIAVTASGQRRPIRWLGHRTVDCTLNPGIRALWPVRVAAHAFGPSMPSHDLYLSPGHSVCVSVIDEVLIPIQELVNGSTIAYVEMDEVTYWHVELDSHDILIANDLPAESFLEMGANRALLDDAVAPDLPVEVLERTHANFCRPFVDGGPLLAVLRQRLEERAARLGWTRNQEAALGCTAGRRDVAPVMRDGEAFFALPAGDEAVTLRCPTIVPALIGGCDTRRLGVAVYALELIGADGQVRALDLDGPELAGCFHSGERDERLHYRWSAADIVVPGSARAGLAAPTMLRLVFEPSTLRGWNAPPPEPERQKLRVLA